MTLETYTFALDAGASQRVTLTFETTFPAAGYAFVCLMKNPLVAVHTSEQRVTGILSVSNTQNPAVSNYGAQRPTQDIGVDAFEFWVPLRRPGGHNLAFSLSEPLTVFGTENLTNGWLRPTRSPNAWVASPTDPHPTISLIWEQPQTIRQIDLYFDPDYDHPMESVLMTHAEREMPFCVKAYRLHDQTGTVLAVVENNHQSHHTIRLEQPISTTCLQLELLATHSNSAPAALFGISCY